MEISLKILSLLHLTTSALCFQLLPSFSVKTPVDFELEINGNLFNSKPINNEPDKLGSNQCFCLPSDPQNELVTNFLGPKDHKLERLVVYLYKIDGTVQAFIPNKQKQKRIPDLNFNVNDGDVLKSVYSDTVIEIFENNPSILSWQPEAIQFEPKDVSVEEDTSADIDTQPSIDLNDTPYIDPENEIIEPIAEETLDTKPTDASIFDNTFSEQDKTINDLLLPSPQDAFLNNLKFDDWINNQLSHGILHNSGSQFNLVDLKNRIQDVLKANRIFISRAGYLIDFKGNPLKISNIKLQPILIGDPVEYHTFNHQTGYHYVAPKEISYFQVILILSVNPPSILGVVPMGKVVLPRQIISQKWTNQNDGKMHFIKLLPQLGCKNCKSPAHDTQQADFRTMYNIPYFELPLRRNFDNIKDAFRSFSEAPSDIGPEPEGRANSDGKNDLSGVLQSLLGIFGKPNLFSESRRLLGGRIFTNENLRPNGYINDILPDYRIIGGKPATSSGIPLVSKGRSGYLG